VKRKIREVIKEENEEKDSLFNEIKFKSQAAMEYLMTYGWAILIIALVLGVLYSLGIMNPKNFIPRAPPGSCFVFRPNGPGTTDFVSLQGTCGYLPMYVASFNGVNAYIKIADSQSLDITNAITIMAWVYPKTRQTVSDRDGIVIKGGAYYLTITPTGYVAVYFYGLANPGYHVGAIIVPLNQWSLIATTYDSATGKIRIYVNNNLDREISTSGVISTTTNQLAIGSEWTGSSRFFNGSIANVQIYNTALTPQEIQYLYQQGLGGGPVRLQNLVAWWPLNGDAKDYSGNNNHGTINGGVTFVQNYNPP
jgi:hypothetical protein